MDEPVLWLGDGSPHSARFNDRYRSRAGGLAQALSVFLAGCGLPGRWRGREQYTVLETGFGLGLNFLTTWARWEADAQHCDVLHFVSVEGYPVAAADIARSAGALSLPDQASSADATRDANQADGLLRARIALLAQELCKVWHDLTPGVHRFHFANGQVVLTLAIGEILPMLECLSGAADAVYLDGFSPALNADMWSLATLGAVARLCRPGATLASYTVAGHVRAALEQLGFRVEKCLGLAPKRQRLQAVYLPGG